MVVMDKQSQEFLVDEGLDGGVRGKGVGDLAGTGKGVSN